MFYLHRHTSLENMRSLAILDGILQNPSLRNIDLPGFYSMRSFVAPLSRKGKRDAKQSKDQGRTGDQANTNPGEYIDGQNNGQG